MTHTGRKPKERYELSKLNIHTRNIVWDSVKTLSGWKTGYSMKLCVKNVFGQEKQNQMIMNG